MGSDRVFRGGDWDDYAWYRRSAYRDYFYMPDSRIIFIGFRVLLVPGQ
jgi:formylglycine-generating enzyme required for sulfatase activity